MCIVVANLEAICKDLHKKLSLAEEERYDLQRKLYKQESDVSLMIFAPIIM